MANDHLEGEKHAGDWGVEAGRDRRRHAATKKRARLRASQAEGPAQPTGDGRAEMHRRSLTPGRGAGPDRRGVDQGGANALTQRHAAGQAGIGLDHMRDALRPATGHETVAEIADQQAAGGGRQQETPRRQFDGAGGHVFMAKAQEKQLEEVNRLTKDHRPGRRRNPDPQGQEMQR